jgi:peptidoglycan/xylan/chitin deacetylase (PgdA/CDA1 family)
MSELRVALTFDAEHPSRRQCPPEAARTILDSLSKANVRATFFVQGRWATAYPELARSIARAGHVVGNHSHWHAPMSELSDHGLTSDVASAEQSIRTVLEVDPRPWFRCPFGVGADDPRVKAALASCGYRNVHWDVAADDWEDDRSARDVEDAAVEGVLARGDGAIVLLHTWPAAAMLALPGIIKRLRSEGAEFVTVADLPDAT